MADTSNLSQFLTDVADAIRTKKGTTEPIPAANFDTEILSIETCSQENLQEQLDAQDLIIQQLQEELSDKAIYDCNYYNARLVPTNGKITFYITEISTQLDTSNITNMQSMFNGCTNLTTIPLLDTSNVTTMNSMFQNCTNLTTIPLLNTGKVTDMNYMFSSCRNITTIPELNTSNVTTMYQMFSNCTNLTTIPELNTGKVTDMDSMFQNCTNLTTIPQLDTSNAIRTSNMFYGCTNLTTIPLLDTSSATSMYSMFWRLYKSNNYAIVRY